MWISRKEFNHIINDLESKIRVLAMKEERFPYHPFVQFLTIIYLHYLQEGLTETEILEKLNVKIGMIKKETLVDEIGLISTALKKEKKK